MAQDGVFIYPNALLKCYNINDNGEAPAYTIGFLVSKMLKKMMNVNL